MRYTAQNSKFCSSFRNIARFLKHLHQIQKYLSHLQIINNFMHLFSSRLCLYYFFVTHWCFLCVLDAHQILSSSKYRIHHLNNHQCHLFENYLVFFIIYVDVFVCLHTFICIVCAVPIEARRGYQFPLWNYSSVHLN